MLKQINFIYLLIFFIGGCSQMETKAPLIPMEDFMRNPEKSSFQFGILAHKKGFKEPAHYHRPFKRTIDDLQQMFVVQKGKIRVDLFSDSKKLIRKIILKKGDAIVLIHGIHAITVLEDMQCISVKQGPFLGADFDKVNVKVKK